MSQEKTKKYRLFLSNKSSWEEATIFDRTKLKRGEKKFWNFMVEIYIK
jgi:hypothetical protein